MKKYLIKLVRDEIKSLEKYIKNTSERVSVEQTDDIAPFFINHIEKLKRNKKKAENYLKRLEQMEF